jgi:hypothetical protein
MPASPYPTALLAELQAALSADAVLHGAEDLRPYECDGLAALRELPLCVALPTDREGVQVTGEHGVGVEKLDSMCVQFNAAELAQLHRIKHAFDPEDRLNPGKAVPSLHRCAELGAMHVHHGQLPFPELERF